MGFHIYKIWQILKRFFRQLISPHITNFRRVLFLGKLTQEIHHPLDKRILFALAACEFVVPFPALFLDSAQITANQRSIGLDDE